MLKLTKNDETNYLKYAELRAPRYTSYPPIPFWKDKLSFSEKAKILSVETGNQIAFYFHIPFCQKLCFYCGCQKEIINPESARAQVKMEEFLRSLRTELELHIELLQGKTIGSIHFGGGTPNILSPSQWQELFSFISSNFHLAKRLELSIEVDPRTLTKEHLCTFSQIGVNRLSLGVQDFDLKIQKAINRTQSFDMVSNLCEQARSLGIKEINFDLIYALPFQTPASLKQTLEKVLVLRPTRIAYYRLAIVSELFQAQKNFADKDLPKENESITLNRIIQKTLQDAGYQAIAMDHFALKDDALARAARNETMHRNFQGMTTGASYELFGFGPSAISMVGDCYLQNPKDTQSWMSSLKTKAKDLKFHKLNPEDKRRKWVIDQIFCKQKIDKNAFYNLFGVDFDKHFSKLLPQLKELASQNLLRLEANEIEVLEPMGRLLQRVVAYTFDEYSPHSAKAMASKVG